MSLITSITSNKLSAELVSNEGHIRSGQKAWYEIGKYLTVICNEEQYLERGFKSWEEYCLTIHDISRSMSYKYMSSYAVYTVLVDFGFTGQALPLTESQARPMAKLLDDQDNFDERDMVKTVWKDVLSSGNKVTAARVTAVVNVKLGIAPPIQKEKKKTVEDTISNSTGTVAPNTGIEDVINPQQDTMDLDKEIELLEARVIELEGQLLKARKTSVGIAKTKLAQEMIKAGFKALSNSADAGQMEEIIACKDQLLG